MQNKLEIVNESLTMMCAYCMISFTGMVSDPGVRYICGWPLVALVILLILLNLVVILYQGITLIIRNCKLRYTRRKNIQKYREAKTKQVRSGKDKIKEQAKIFREVRPED